MYWLPSGPTYVPVAGSYSAVVTGAGGGAAAAAGAAAVPVRGCGTGCPDSVAFGSPFQLKPSLRGMYSSSLLHIAAVGARFPGFVKHGALRAPRTLNGESVGTLQ